MILLVIILKRLIHVKKSSNQSLQTDYERIYAIGDAIEVEYFYIITWTVVHVFSFHWSILKK
ncbi:MAG: hypothetical protein ACOC3B_01650, partial [Bacillota bacterium]